jgi:hypothetical protein
MNGLKEMEDAFNEFLRKYENGEIPKEEWETRPVEDLHIFRRRTMIPVPPDLLREFSESESSSCQEDDSAAAPRSPVTE